MPIVLGSKSFIFASWGFLQYFFRSNLLINSVSRDVYSSHFSLFLKKHMFILKLKVFNLSIEEMYTHICFSCFIKKNQYFLKKNDTNIKYTTVRLITGLPSLKSPRLIGPRSFTPEKKSTTLGKHWARPKTSTASKHFDPGLTDKRQFPVPSGLRQAKFKSVQKDDQGPLSPTAIFCEELKNHPSLLFFPLLPLSSPLSLNFCEESSK